MNQSVLWQVSIKVKASRSRDRQADGELSNTGRKKGSKKEKEVLDGEWNSLQTRKIDRHAHTRHHVPLLFRRHKVFNLLAPDFSIKLQMSVTHSPTQSGKKGGKKAVARLEKEWSQNPHFYDSRSIRTDWKRIWTLLILKQTLVGCLRWCSLACLAGFS